MPTARVRQPTGWKDQFHGDWPANGGWLPGVESGYATVITVGQLARKLGLDVGEVSKAVRRALPEVSPRDARDLNFRLTERQVRLIKDEVGHSAAAPALPEETPEEPEQPGDCPVETVADSVAEQWGLALRPLNLWIHQDVLHKLERWEHLRGQAAAVLQRLAAHGRTSVVKGCRGGGNRGWRRSPLGGNRGMQFYLWWGAGGGERARAIQGVPPDAMVVRDIRHHDEHRPLDGGKAEDYLHGQNGAELERDVGSPWTEEQLDFIGDDSPIRVVDGQPGSGKTTALWRAVEARAGEKVLYLTWSRELTELALQRFRAFAPSTVEVIARDFVTFLGEVCGTDIRRNTLAESQRLFRKAAAATRLRRELDIWKGREDALFAEVRAILIGAASPERTGSAIGSGVPRLGGDEYRELRKSMLDERVAKSVERIGKALSAKTLAAAFPELAGAAKAIQVLANGSLPDGLDNVVRVVVDEAQDLTLLETAVLVEFCLALARKLGHTPWLLVAGDEGQTVRPSGFEWSRLNDLLAKRIGAPKRFPLEGAIRCPARIADVVERAGELYGWLDKPQRPRRQRSSAVTQAVDAQVFHVVVADDDGARKLVERLAEMDDIAVVSLEPDKPTWLPETLKAAVATPDEVKGQEYATVCVLSPGRCLAWIRDADGKDTLGDRLTEQARRTMIDRLRVAVSRSTEKLAFVDAGASATELNLSRDLLGAAVPYEPEDLVEHLVESDATPEERVEGHLSEARALVDERPLRAWQRAEQAMLLIGDPDLPNGVADPELRARARTTMLATAARLLVDGVPEWTTRQEVIETVHKTLAALESEAPDDVAAARGAFEELAGWTDPEARRSPLRLLEVAAELGGAGEWLTSALPPVAQELRNLIQVSAGDWRAASHYSGNVEGWLRVTGYAGDAESEARRLRIEAADALLDREPVDVDAAAAVARLIAPEELRVTARLLEAKGKLEEATAAFERAGLPDESLRVWRQAGDWERAIRLATGPELRDLEWLHDAEALAGRRPSGLDSRLTPAERHRLGKLLGATCED